MPKGFDVNYTLALLQLTAAQKYWFGPSTLPADVGGQRDKDSRRIFVTGHDLPLLRKAARR
jgi:hypothetical protein